MSKTCWQLSANLFQNCFKIQPLLHPRPPNSNSCVHLHRSHTAKLKDHRLSQMGWFSKPRALCPQQGLTVGALAALQLRHLLQNLVLLRKIPRHSCTHVSLGVARLVAVRRLPGDGMCPVEIPGVAGMNGSEQCHMFAWLVIAGGASTEPPDRNSSAGCAGPPTKELHFRGCSLPATTVLVRYLNSDPFPPLIPKGANRNKLPSSSHSLSAHSPQVHWVEAGSNPCYHRSSS